MCISNSKKNETLVAPDFNCIFGCLTDNLAANFSRELADYIIYIIDVSGGDKIPRKGGPGITQADLLVCEVSTINQFTKVVAIQF